MHTEDRLIHFSTELFHKPKAHPKPLLQKLYYELSQVPGCSYDNSDFNIPNQPKFHSRRGPKSQSVLVMLPDRLLIMEEWADLTLDAYVRKLEDVAAVAESILEIPAFTAQAVTVRATCPLSHFDDAREFLLDHACAQEGQIAPYFKRPIAVGGLRFVLPATPQHDGAYHILIEPFRQSPREIFVEVKSVYKDMGEDENPFPLITKRLRDVRGFISDNIYPYLDQFDTPTS